MQTDFDQIKEMAPFPEFYAAWQAARHDGAIPVRGDIRLRDFAPFADSLQIYELKNPQDLRCRLMGSRVSDRVPNVSPEHNLFDFFGHERARKIGELWWVSMAKVPCGGVMCFSTSYESGAKRAVPSMVLPITGVDGSAQFIAFNNLPKIIGSGEPRQSMVIADDSFEGKFFDVGFGLPEDVQNPLFM